MKQRVQWSNKTGCSFFKFLFEYSKEKFSLRGSEYRKKYPRCYCLSFPCCDEPNSQTNIQRLSSSLC